MLQQTQVTTVIPYYLRFMRRFPSVEALARASLDEVLALWQGLGYYSRARNLHAAACLLMREHAGQVPADRAALLNLPGIGDYTAGAILSIAFGLDYVACDANVKRVLARVTDYVEPVATPTGHKAISACARALLPIGSASSFNQGMMDLGAMVCLPHGPACASCPVAAWCLARERQVQEQRPVRILRAKVPTHRMAGALIQRVDGSWLALRRRPSGLLGGLWELPMVPWPEQDPEPAPARLQAELGKLLQLELCQCSVGLVLTHAYTHMRIVLHLYPCESAGTPCLATDSPWDAWRWMDEPSLEQYGITGLTRKALAASLRPTLYSSRPGIPGSVMA